MLLHNFYLCVKIILNAESGGVEKMYRTVDGGEIEFSDFELSRRLSMPVSEMKEEAEAIKYELIMTAVPKYTFARVKIFENGKRFYLFDFESHDLDKYLSGCEAAFVFVATLGAQVDRLIDKIKARSVYKGFLYNAVASAMIEAVCDKAEQIICRKEKVKPRVSPGYGDFPLLMNKAICEYLSCSKNIGVSVGDTLMMQPLKTVCAIVGIKNES